MSIETVPAKKHISPRAKDVLVRAGRTFVQAFLPSVVYATRNEHAIAYPVLLSGAIGASAAALSVLWNGSSALLSARRDRQLLELAAFVESAVKAAQGPTAPSPTEAAVHAANPNA
jgi:hypothetical protein